MSYEDKIIWSFLAAFASFGILLDVIVNLNKF